MLSDLDIASAMKASIVVIIVSMVTVTNIRSVIEYSLPQTILIIGLHLNGVIELGVLFSKSMEVCCDTQYI